jgi:hypothetical protein
MMTVTPQRHGRENSSSESAVKKHENVELVAFGRPPPLPPVLGPLVAFSFFQMSSGDDKK